jgi:hypothetical protein
MLHTVKVDSNGFKGSYTIEVPKFTQRLRYIKECNFKLDASGNLSVSIEESDAIIKMIEIASQHVKELNIEHVESGKKFDSMEQMEYDSDCDGILNEIGAKMLSGVQLGKS